MAAEALVLAAVGSLWRSWQHKMGLLEAGREAPYLRVAAAAAAMLELHAGPARPRQLQSATALPVAGPPKAAATAPGREAALGVPRLRPLVALEGLEARSSCPMSACPTAEPQTLKLSRLDAQPAAAAALTPGRIVVLLRAAEAAVAAEPPWSRPAAVAQPLTVGQPARTVAQTAAAMAERQNRPLAVDLSARRTLQPEHRFAAAQPQLAPIAMTPPSAPTAVGSPVHVG